VNELDRLLPTYMMYVPLSFMLPCPTVAVQCMCALRAGHGVVPKAQNFLAFRRPSTVFAVSMLLHSEESY
jgi:hypothetical protein